MEGPPGDPLRGAEKGGFLTSGTTADWRQRGLASGNQESMSSAKVAVLCLGRFLSSNFILVKKVPHFWSAKKEGIHIFPIILRPCAWKHVQMLAQ